MKSNKFNASWQLARVQAKKIKDVSLKVEHVMLYFTKNTNIHDQDRVLNWLATTAMAYRDSATKEIFSQAANFVRSIECDSYDNTSTVQNLSINDIKLVHKDLASRKYGFQFKKVPQAHIDFVIELEGIINAH